jgi:hypothetical protein
MSRTPSIGGGTKLGDNTLIVGPGCAYTGIQSAIDAAVASPNNATVGDALTPAKLYEVVYMPGVAATWRTNPYTGYPLTTDGADASGVIIRRSDEGQIDAPLKRFYSTNLQASKVVVRIDDAAAMQNGLTRPTSIFVQAFAHDDATTAYRDKFRSMTPLTTGSTYGGTLKPHGLVDGSIVWATATAAGLTINTAYYVKYVDATTFYLYAEAGLSTLVQLTASAGLTLVLGDAIGGFYLDSETAHVPLTPLTYATRKGVPLSSAVYTNNLNKQVTAMPEVAVACTLVKTGETANAVYAANHGLETYDTVVFKETQGAITAGYVFWVAKVNANEFKLVLPGRKVGVNEMGLGVSNAAANYYTGKWTATVTGLVAGMTVWPATANGVTAGTPYYIHSITTPTGTTQTFRLSSSATATNIVEPATATAVTFTTDQNFTTATLRRATQLNGLEVMSHTVTHVLPTADDEAAAEVLASKAYLETMLDTSLALGALKWPQDLGIDCRCFIQAGWGPVNNNNAYTVNSGTKQRIAFARLIKQTYPCSQAYVGISRRDFPHFGAVTVGTNTAAWLAAAALTRPVDDMIIQGHTFVPSGATGNDVLLSAFKTMIDAIAAWRELGYCVPVTCSQMYEDVPQTAGATAVRGGVPYGDFTGVTNTDLATSGSVKSWVSNPANSGLSKIASRAGGTDIETDTGVDADGSHGNVLRITQSGVIVLVGLKLVAGQHYRLRFSAQCTGSNTLRVYIQHRTYYDTDDITEGAMQYMAADAFPDTCLCGDGASKPYIVPATTWGLHYLGFTVPKWAMQTQIGFSHIGALASSYIYIDDVSLEPNIVG